MIILKIYKLEDPEEAEPLSTLSEGEHIIGRGFLNVRILTFLMKKHCSHLVILVQW